LQIPDYSFQSECLLEQVVGPGLAEGSGGEGEKGESDERDDSASLPNECAGSDDRSISHDATSG
jgi:hypothetical protein